ncbi:hypothetical protein OUZ56_002225 [Daphnia magna]|uniref:Uncharacterized protein n=1 Tax=Daphnia magna TaxID=35525 RepID=A0ABR0A5I2_9CRUS|nr:hypothetical protein OUZ56_002225 [Daphnia magna]
MSDCRMVLYGTGCQISSSLRLIPFTAPVVFFLGSAYYFKKKIASSIRLEVGHVAQSHSIVPLEIFSKEKRNNPDPLCYESRKYSFALQLPIKTCIFSGEMSSNDFLWVFGGACVNSLSVV